MAIWPTSVSVTPELSRTEWKVVELDDGWRHFVGVAEGVGRAPSLVTAYESTTRCGITVPCRRCVLSVGAGIHPDAEYVLNQWIQLYVIERVTDVTEEYH